VVTELEGLRKEVYRALIALPRTGLVKGTSGNVSGREGDLVVIKPSGVAYEALSPDKMVVVDLSGEVIEGGLRPSVDTSAHLYIYRGTPELGGVVHTHSVYATVFAVLGRDIPVYLTELADLFGGEDPGLGIRPSGGRADRKRVYGEDTARQVQCHPDAQSWGFRRRGESRCCPQRRVDRRTFRQDLIHGRLGHVLSQGLRGDGPPVGRFSLGVNSLPFPAAADPVFHLVGVEPDQLHRRLVSEQQVFKEH